jgi:hypothetical protein
LGIYSSRENHQNASALVKAIRDTKKEGETRGTKRFVAPFPANTRIRVTFREEAFEEAF